MQRDMRVEQFPNYHNFQLQAEESESSGTPDLSAGGAGIETEQTVTFVDNEVGVVVQDLSTQNNVALVDGTEDLSLGQYLGRPTLVDTTTWLAADIVGVKTTILPWYLFLNNTLIKKKLDNYCFLRANLHVKVLLNGTPFQYGQMRVHYSPLEGLIPSKVRATTTPVPTLVPYSQQPGFYIYPQANSGGEMVLPFFFHRNWLDITTAGNVQNFGTLRYTIYAPLGSAVAGGSTSVTIRTYAWMSDVHLMGSTTKLSLQADEYGVGPISRPASALATMASTLTKVPIIGRFARATEIGASAVSQMASLFGFTNVPVIADVHGFQPMNAPMLASSQIGTPIQKLSLDPKQELSIDPSPHGIGTMDELALAHLKTRESYFGATSWSTADAGGTLLFNARVTPVLCTQNDVLNSVAAVVGQRVYHTPLSWLSTLFANWRGDIIIRMKVVCTKFHKGRLKISYDPVTDIATTDPPENAVYTQIVDIGEGDDIEIRIPYHQALGWLKMRAINPDNWAPGLPAMAPTQGFDNGMIGVRVLTALTAPASGSINLLFFVRAADNFEFANPVDKIKGLTNSTYPTPSFFALQADDKVDVVTKTISLGPPAVVFPERYGLNFGESIASLRSVLHRAVVSDIIPNITGATGFAQFWFKNYQRMPYTPGYQNAFTATSALNIVAAAGNNTYAFNDMNHIPYIASPFLGYRGGVNYHVTPSSDAYGFVDDIRVARITNPLNQSAAAAFGSIGIALPYAATISSAARFHGVESVIEAGVSGMATTSNRTNSTVSFNIPDLNEHNFSLVNPVNYVFGSTADGTDCQGARVAITLKNKSVGTDNGQQAMTVISEASAGPDFTCLFFLCIPTMDYALATPPAL
jgi:hypothetical protein